MNRYLVAMGSLLAAAPIGAAEMDPCAAPDGLADVTLELSIADSPVFREGEAVPLRLSFSTTTPDRYLVDPANPRTGRRHGFEAYCVEPTAPDPLLFYEGRVQADFHPSSPSRLLDARVPFATEVDLNEWRTLTAGRYRVFVVSHRVQRLADPGAADPVAKLGMRLRSNTVGLEVRSASAAWVKQQMLSATQSVTPLSPKEKARRGARSLRFLNTQESTKALAALFLSYDHGWEIREELLQGLYGSPHRDLALRAMEGELSAPAHPITSEFVSSLVAFEIAADPAWRVSPGSLGHWASFQVYWEARTVHSEALKQAALLRLAAVAGRKRGAARATSLATVLALSGTDRALANSIRPQLLANWKELPVSDQAMCLGRSWPIVRSPDMVPILLRMAEQPGSSRPLRNAVLRDLYDVDPWKARELILSDLLDGSANPGRDLIELLTPAGIARAVGPAIARIAYTHAWEADYVLLESYADSSAVSIVEAAFRRDRPGTFACAHQAAMLRYLLRVGPEVVAPTIEAALHERDDTACYRTIFGDLRTLGPAVEPIAIGALDDPSPEVVVDASRALSRWGSSDAESAIWARLQRFHDEWAGKEASLEASPAAGLGRPKESRVGAALISALLQGLAWTCPPQKLLRLRDLALTTSDKRGIDAATATWGRVPVVIRASCEGPSPQPRFTVLQYQDLSQTELLLKMSQGPLPQRWLFSPGGCDPASSQAAYETLRAAAAQDGLALGREEHP
jgi:hypothetical protein